MGDVQMANRPTNRPVFICVPKPTSRLRHCSGPTVRGLMRMVEQNGGKFQGLKNSLKKSGFVGINKCLRRTSLLDV